MRTMTTSESEKYDCRTCGACCMGCKVFECNTDYYKKYGILFEMRELYFMKREGKIYCMSQPCKHLDYKEGIYSCLIEDTKPDVCKQAKPGEKICLEARKFK